MTLNKDMDVDTNGTRRISIKRKTPDDGLKDEVAKKAKHQSSTFQVVLHSSSMQQNEEKKIDEITFENACKKNMQIRRQFLPTIVVTSIKSKELKSATSVMFITTGRSGVLCQRDLHHSIAFNVFSYESCWVEISYPAVSIEKKKLNPPN
ncbi:hypothetical protein RFI_36773 [Reticulomyxa filosa]|uniref:Uncharacterized protein n=1 Tax=Reticulomyxa filosa TaxID=46433 RepID=X6LHP7_RETFI|nr:hypothetical protein RFI_36773 [Reticulomyxa filosa]|eukprot:ETO00667.1 hypothetical protein RFI_36773 [Reticulomyxa filosa]